jgi:hypothetical protein
LIASGRKYPRDIGRPVSLGGNTYYIFGDTFCFDPKEAFVGISNNTVAYVPNPTEEPCISQYIPDQSHQPTFIPHSPSEERYENDSQNKHLNNRVVNWCFGGIIEDSPGSSLGWVFYEKMFTASVIDN